MSTIKGYVDKIRFRNQDNGYTILQVISEGQSITVVGTFGIIDVGDYIEAKGSNEIHKIYGEQFRVISYTISRPHDIESIKNYLSSGAIKGIGTALASRIVDTFGEDTIRIMEDEPEKLVKIKGISERIAVDIASQVAARSDKRNAMMFLYDYGISMNYASKIYEQYGEELYSIIKNNPYKLAEDITGIGFKKADEIARKSGILADSRYRIKSCILYILSIYLSNGHMYIPQDILLRECADMLEVDASDISEILPDMHIEHKINIVNIDDGNAIYLPVAYMTELSTAGCLRDIDDRLSIDREEVIAFIRSEDDRDGILLDDMQLEAVIEAIKSNLIIITGGPGTGKTTIINRMIRYFEHEGLEILLAAPTGRAAKRMTETTAHEAMTIHRLLEVGIISDTDDDGIYGDERFGFGRDESNPLEADVIIIDEMSMVDIWLMNALVRAIPQGAKLILVGDVNQLPSVGPGNVLRDMIDSKCFDVVRLDKIYRQSDGSDIVTNAHKMISGENIDLTTHSKDFLFIKESDSNVILDSMITLLVDKLPSYVGTDSDNIQIMTPMRKGEMGVDRLNKILQSRLNPPIYDKLEVEIKDMIYRIGDKVMQIKNNYDKKWIIKDAHNLPISEGRGIYNGDIGRITDINIFAETIDVTFDDERIVRYEYDEADELELAYAITVHKSQGNEYPAVIMPIVAGPAILYTRNLIYTAITRAKKCVVMIGEPTWFYNMVANTSEIRRYSGLKDRIKELYV